jgi:ribosomal protein S18 acetylase RimI-like enzyme
MPTVRPATEADLDALAGMGDTLARQHHDYDAGRFLYDAGFREGYRWWFGRELGRDEVFLGVVDGKEGPAGYLYGRLEGKDWNALLEAHAALVDVFVRPDERGSGVGEALVEAFCAWAAARGFPQVVLSTATQNAGAQRLFAKLGFRPTMVELTRG